MSPYCEASYQVIHLPFENRLDHLILDRIVYVSKHMHQHPATLFTHIMSEIIILCFYIEACGKHRRVKGSQDVEVRVMHPTLAQTRMVTAHILTGGYGLSTLL